jgi:hypothetical protein
MSPDTLDRAFRWVFDSGLAREPFTLLWHAGVTLALLESPSPRECARA